MDSDNLFLASRVSTNPEFRRCQLLPLSCTPSGFVVSGGSILPRSELELK
jgi:hypothetical protein